MLYLSYLFQHLRQCTVYADEKNLPETCPQEVDFIDDQKSLCADKTWIGAGEETVRNLQNAEIEPGTVIFICEHKSNYVILNKNPEITVIYLSCPRTNLFIMINKILTLRQIWLDKYATADDQSLYAMLNLTSDFAESPVILLNPNYRIVLSCKLEESKFLAGHLDQTGALPKKIADSIFINRSEKHLPVEYKVAESGIRLYGYRIYHEDQLVSVILIESSIEQTEIDCRGLCVCAGQAIHRHILPANSLKLGTYTKDFRQFWMEIMDQSLTQTFEIIQRLRLMPFPIETFVRVIVVTFRNKNTKQTPSSFIFAQLREVFPDCNMTIHENEVVILQTYPQRTFNLNLDTKRLETILERHNGFIGISNGTRDFGNLRSLYILAKNTIPLACELRENLKERIFFYEEFWIYTAIDMCAHRFYELHHHNDIVYLIHPAVVHLTRYDRDHNTNLRDTLFYYLLNDRNLVKTAAVTYAHRNTVINKVNKINKLIELDLEDGILRQRIIFSCQMIRYHEKYMKRELKI